MVALSDEVVELRGWGERVARIAECGRLQPSLDALYRFVVVVELLSRRDVVDEPLEVELAANLQRLEVAKGRVVDDVHQRAPSVEEPQDAVHLVGNLRESVDQLAVVDFEHAIERRELLQQSPPLIDAAHAFHQEPLRRQVDLVVLVVGLKLHRERALVPDEHSVERLLTLEAAGLRVDHLAVAEGDLGLLGARLDVEVAGLAADLDGLHEVDQTHLTEDARERPALAAVLEV